MHAKGSSAPSQDLGGMAISLMMPRKLRLIPIGALRAEGA
jgi:hypothetical protein